jgi:hypothetical protein
VRVTELSLLANIREELVVAPLDVCWVWTKSCNVKNGYGQVSVGRVMRGAHKVSYETFVGPVPRGLELDHLCRVRACIRPSHLEPVTRAENVRRAKRYITHCPQNHEYTQANTYWYHNTVRYCRACDRERKRRARATTYSD